MEELLKPQLITKARGFRQIAAFVCVAGAVLQLVAIIALPMYTLTFNFFDPYVKNSLDFTVYKAVTDYVIIRKGTVGFYWSLVVMAVLQIACAAGSLPLPAVLLALVNVIRCPLPSKLIDFYYFGTKGTAHNAVGRYVLVLGLLVQVAAVALTLMDKIGASGTNFAAAGRPTVGAVTGAAPVNPTPAAPAKTAFKAPAAPAALCAQLTDLTSGKPYILSMERPVQIGSNAGVCAVVLIGDGVAPVHARIYCQNNVFYLEDAGTGAAAQINGAPLTPRTPTALSNGVTITIAGKNLRFNVG